VTAFLKTNSSPYSSQEIPPTFHTHTHTHTIFHFFFSTSIHPLSVIISWRDGLILWNLVQSEGLRLTPTLALRTGTQVAQTAVDAAFKHMNVPKIIEPLEVILASLTPFSFY
jgi:hypothetical protein